VEDTPMGAYFVALFAMSVSAVSALTLFYAVNHFDGSSARH
jgi:hypothetical protein